MFLMMPAFSKPVLPNALEMFDPIHTENVQTPLTGMVGNISDKYTIIPQFKGKYTIKPIEFSYYDLASKSYKTITSDEITIDVAEGDNVVASSAENTNTTVIILTSVSITINSISTP